MKNGYDQFFKNARKASQSEKRPAGNRFSIDESALFQMTESQVDERLKKRAGVPRHRPKKSTPWKLIAVSFLGLLLAGGGLIYAEELEQSLKRLEVSFMNLASAQEAPPAATKPATAPSVPPPSATRQPSGSDLDHLGKLTERQKELDVRAEELTRQEGELAKMKEELERRLAELESMRNQISEILAERVKVDAEKVATLVEMYSNMKPPQAAKIFESLDEDLAVELLSRMKKKSAADIMNLLPPEKAQVFSERYAGYKRK